MAAPYDDTELEELFGTTRPSVEAVDGEGFGEMLEGIERGTSRYVVAYEGDRPTKILFAGYSFD